MTGGIRRFRPAGIAGRLTLVLVLLLIVALWASAFLYVRDRAQTTIRLFTESVAERIAAIVPLLERTPPEERPALLPALGSPTLRIGLADGPRMPPGWRVNREQAERIRALLPDLGRPVEVRFHWHWHRPVGPRFSGGAAEPPDLLDSRAKAIISIPLEGGGRVHFVASTDTTSLRWALRTGFWMTVASLAILVVAFWAAHRMTRPLRRFADAAERIGLDIRSEPLPETGPRELRNATRAFNRMRERLQRLVDDRTMMLAAISHDLRTLLTRLMLRAEFIEDDRQRDRAVADLNEMRAMLDSTLEFARDDAVDGPRTPADLAGLVRDLCGELDGISWDGPEHLSYTCSPGALRRALRNILANAVEYGGGAEVAMWERGEGIEVSVADRGPGIPPGSREDVFRPFHRLEASRNRETGGSGLGLAVARSIVRRHGGDIALDGRPGGGLVVRIVLPRP